MFKKINKEKPQWQDIKIEITITQDKINWTANIDNIDLIFYLTRIIHFINLEMDKIK